MNFKRDSITKKGGYLGIHHSQTLAFKYIDRQPFYKNLNSLKEQSTYKVAYTVLRHF